MRYTKLLIPACLLFSVIGGCTKSTRPPETITPLKIITNTFAYVAGYYGIDVCNVNSETGKFTGCQESGFAAYAYSQSPLITLDGSTIAILTVGTQTFAYVTDNNNYLIYQCLINPNTGLFTSCNQATATAFSSAIYGIAFNTAQNGNTYAYIGNSTIQKCLVDSNTGLLSGCANTAVPVSSSALFSFTTIGAQTYIYIMLYDSYTPNTQYCPVTNAGDFGTCTTQNVTELVYPYAIGFTTIENQTYAYISQTYPDDNGNNPLVMKCSINSSNGSFTNCIPTLNGNYYAFPAALTVQSIDNQTFVYVGNSPYEEEYGNQSVIQCAINPETAKLQNCSDSGIGSNFPSFTSTIAFATFTNVL